MRIVRHGERYWVEIEYSDSRDIYYGPFSTYEDAEQLICRFCGCRAGSCPPFIDCRTRTPLRGV
jgi:hypothetical protein